MKPALLLIPGMLNDADVWREVADALGELADVRIAVPLQASIAEMARAAWAQLADLPTRQPIVIAGFSLGGYVAIDMLARPERPLHAAALLATSARPETPASLAARDKTIAAMQGDFGQTVERIVQFNTHEPSAPLAQRLSDMMLRIGAAAAIRQLRAIAARADHRQALATVALPVTILCGRHDRTTPVTLAAELAALVPGARCEVVPDAGHMLPVEQPQAVVRALRELLRGAAQG